jgi:hypothetical protein
MASGGTISSGVAIEACFAGESSMHVRKRVVARTAHEQDFVETEFADGGRFRVGKLGLMLHDGLRSQLERSPNFITAKVLR